MAKPLWTEYHAIGCDEQHSVATTCNVPRSFTVKQVAVLLNMKPQGVYSLIESGRLPAFNVASELNKRASWRITEEALRRFQNPNH